MGITPSGLISDPPPSSPHFYAGCPSGHNAPLLSWLGTGTKYTGLHTQNCQILGVEVNLILAEIGLGLLRTWYGGTTGVKHPVGTTTMQELARHGTT